MTFEAGYLIMVTMKVQLQINPNLTSKTGFLVLPIFEQEKPIFENDTIIQFLKENPDFGKPHETESLYCTDTKILLVGVGKKEKFNFETAQNFAGTAAKTLASKTKDLSLIPPTTGSFPLNQSIEAMVLGLELASHDPGLLYKSEKKPKKLDTAFILLDKNDSEYQESLKKSVVLAESINLARQLSDMPSNEMTPSYFLGVARKIARENKLKITVIDEKKAKLLGMGAFLAIAKGSDEPSYIVALEYTGSLRNKEKWGLVGKGITFDSGGISLKPDKGMNEMKYDMCGAANMLATILAVSKLKLKNNVVAVMALTENLPSGKASKPGDIVRSYSGKTVEIVSTDAEGRLVLMDALTFAQKDLKATKLIDMATLTGAMIVALGDFYSGVFGNNEEFSQQLIEAGKSTGEKFWEMPMDEIFDEMVKSDIADLDNIGKPGSMSGAASSIKGAKFLESVIENNRPWVHLDIAGPAWNNKPTSFASAGATGVGVKTLVELVRSS